MDWGMHRRREQWAIRLRLMAERLTSTLFRLFVANAATSTRRRDGYACVVMAAMHASAGLIWEPMEVQISVPFLRCSTPAERLTPLRATSPKSLTPREKPVRVTLTKVA